MRPRPTRLAAAAACAILALTPAGADAQYFGRNKVQYREFDFQVIQTEHFDIYFYPEEREAAAQAARMAERWHARLGRLLQHRLSGRQPLVLYASHPHFEQTNVLPGEIGESTGGVTEMLRRRIVMPFAGPLAETDHVLGHELVHAYQYDIPAGPQAGAGMGALPLWFVEGMAEYLSLGPRDPHTAMWMRDAVLADRLPSFGDLNKPEFFPYRWGHAWWAYVAGRWGDAAVGELFRAAKASDPEEAVRRVLGIEPKELMAGWHAALRETYGVAKGRAEAAEAYGRLLAREGKLGGEINVSPALSPDGTRVAFLSERGLFSIDVYLADATTGRIIRRLTSTAFSPHVSSLQFIRSAAAWSPDGRRLAIPAVKNGRAALLLVDAESGERQREIELPEIGELFNPAWSPDGRTIAFSAIVGGLTDLFAYDLESGRVRRLTDDAFADLQPAWSPDGRRLAFVTDRFTSRLDELAFGAYRLALLDLASGSITAVPGLAGGKHLNPQWSRDGRRLYFLSDASGATNVYAVDLPGGTPVALTNLATGISGITATSPALSVASGTGRMVFSAYEQGNYRLYAADALGADGAPVRPAELAVVLPPVERRGDLVPALLASVETGLPARTTFPTNDYRPSLALTYVGQPTFAVGVDRFGAFTGGGIALFWSDMLGNHNLITAAQVTSSLNRSFSFRDTAALVGYQNLEHRWNWGLSAEQVPYLSGSIRSGFSVVGGRTVFVEETLLFREVNQTFSGVIAYPFNRSQRVEFGGGFRRISFDQELQVAVYSPITGELLAEETRSLPAPGALNLAEASAALVFDTSIFGPVSPIAGQRYRLELMPMAGTITFLNALADYRGYLMPAQFYTIAARALHFGRYGPDAEHELLFPLFLGYPTLVRGYDIASFDAVDCPQIQGPCAAFDRLVGSRMLVGNLEFRFPLLRPFGLSRAMYGPLPVEIAFFADGGVAWRRGERPSFLGGDRRPVASAGVAIRANVLGFTVLQLSFARPFQRPGKGWQFQFSLAPAF
ncbi:MAG TPA: BamA/TamA family outer membrane protein [Vicinamibacterales bacterium]|nr:BamA/TamA family outer membrane protein [Vicinamibacterales bacterium]